MTDEEKQDVADTLNAAADHVRMKGLHNSGGWGAIYAEDGPCCILGTVQMVQPEDEVGGWHEAVDAIAAALDEHNPHASRLIAPWNDEPERTAEDVINLLMEAAARLRDATT